MADSPAERVDPFAAGREAHDSGRTADENPYDPGTEWANHLSWNDGWNAARDDAQEWDN